MQFRSPPGEGWLWPSLVMTIATGLVAAPLIAVLHFTKMPNPFFSLAGWLGWTIMASGAAILLHSFELMRRGEARPIAALVGKGRSDWRRYLLILFGMMLGGFDLYFFMILKPELDLLFPFWADPHLARVDAWLLGRDAWTLFRGFDLRWLAWIYSPFWFFSVLLTLFWLFTRAACSAKSACIIAYFSIWSIFGPLGQALLSSGGPIFYQRLGFGDRFHAMHVPALTQIIADYLWNTYQARSLGPGAGISAMPSVHIATMAWMVLVFVVYRSRLAIPAGALAIVIYAGSVALGWHYAIDGIVGAIGAAGCFYLASLFCARQRSRQTFELGAMARAELREVGTH